MATLGGDLTFSTLQYAHIRTYKFRMSQSTQSCALLNAASLCASAPSFALPRSHPFSLLKTIDTTSATYPPATGSNIRSSLYFFACNCATALRVSEKKVLCAPAVRSSLRGCTHPAHHDACLVFINSLATRVRPCIWWSVGRHRL